MARLWALRSLRTFLPSAAPPHLPTLHLHGSSGRGRKSGIRRLMELLELSRPPPLLRGFHGTGCGALAASGAPELKGRWGDAWWVHQRGAGAQPQQPFLTALAPEAFTRS